MSLSAGVPGVVSVRVDEEELVESVIDEDEMTVLKGRVDVARVDLSKISAGILRSSR